MKVIGYTGHPDHAIVYIVEMDSGQCVECVESVQPPQPRESKWVLLVSTLFGCPVGCSMCDAGGFYHGKLSASEILDQIDFMVLQRYPDRLVPCKQFKIQFARMGEPALNPAVLEVIEMLPSRFDAPGLMPSISTIAPVSARGFLSRLREIKNRLYPGGRFQLQFSIHTTDPDIRNSMIPVETMSFAEIAEYGLRFSEPGDRKVTLNFALAGNAPLDPSILLSYFSPEHFLIKITPLNPTYRAIETGLISRIDPADPETGAADIIARLRRAGYEVILSIGNTEENFIGSNCGQYLRSHLESAQQLSNGYSYTMESGAGLATSGSRISPIP